MADPIVRPHYFQYQFLNADDFKAEQEYHREMLRRHNSALHTPGVAAGLEVGTAADASSVTVTAGTAIDGAGNELVLANDTVLSLAQHNAGDTVYVTIQYDEQGAEQKTFGGTTDFIRTTEVPKLESTTSQPSDHLQLVLAKVTLDGNKRVAQGAIDESVRVEAGTLEGSVTLAPTDPNVDSTQWVRLGWTAPNQADLTGSLRIERTGPAAPNGNLAVAGNADVGGQLTVSGDSVRWAKSGLTADQGGSIELGGDGSAPASGTPYVDFHYSGKTEEYNVRLINDADGQLTAVGNLRVTGGAITPATGNSPAAGIYFPTNPGGGAGDEAWIRYYAESGETTRLQIGINNDADDRLGLFQAGAERLTIYGGNVGIGQQTPGAKLQISGELALEPIPWGTPRTLPANATLIWNDGNYLRINQNTDGSIPTAAVGGPVIVHVPGTFAPVSLNVGGLSSWRADPGYGCGWFAGHVTVGGLIGAGGRDPVGGLPGGWGGGVHTWDLYAEGTAGAGPAGGPVQAGIINDGTVFGVTKPFLIKHPLEPGTKHLVHAAIEGPEYAVYYRGEATLVDGEAIVELPAYFEALTRAEGRSVLVTSKLDASDRVAPVAASGVENGRFRVKGDAAGFFWEVKAVRADVDPLDAEPSNETHPFVPMRPPEEEQGRTAPLDPRP